ncbi:MAG: hypothetical protein ACXVNR_06770 [Bacteroidia bacterium]
MKTLKLFRQASLIVLALLLPVVSFADTNAEIAAKIKAEEELQMYMEIGCIVAFVGGIIVFLIWKTKHDKQVKEKQMEQMKKIQAAKRRAA